MTCEFNTDVFPGTVIARSAATRQSRGRDQNPKPETLIKLKAVLDRFASARHEVIAKTYELKTAFSPVTVIATTSLRIVQRRGNPETVIQIQTVTGSLRTARHEVIAMTYEFNTDVFPGTVIATTSLRGAQRRGNP